jgi:hypothetical protein
LKGAAKMKTYEVSIRDAGQRDWHSYGRFGGGDWTKAEIKSWVHDDYPRAAIKITKEN